MDMLRGYSNATSQSEEELISPFFNVDEEGEFIEEEDEDEDEDALWVEDDDDDDDADDIPDDTEETF